jgi:hypothetical protein
MGAFTIVFVSLFSALFGAWTTIAIGQAVSGRLMFGRFGGRSSWTPGEIKLAGLGHSVVGLAGVVISLVGGLEFGAHVIPLYWVGSPWGLVTANPLPLVVIGNSLLQLSIELHHRRRPSRTA